jgi:hypothetical protein
MARYAAIASAGVAAPNVHRASTSAGHWAAVSLSTRSCSGASTIRRAEQRVGPRGEHLDVAGPGTEQHSRAVDRPIQLRCIVLTFSGQSVFEIVEQSVRIRGDAHHPLPQPLRNTEVAAPLRLPEVTSSLASTVPRPGTS